MILTGISIIVLKISSTIHTDNAISKLYNHYSNIFRSIEGSSKTYSELERLIEGFDNYHFIINHSKTDDTYLFLSKTNNINNDLSIKVFPNNGIFENRLSISKHLDKYPDSSINAMINLEYLEKNMISSDFFDSFIESISTQNLSIFNILSNKKFLTSTVMLHSKPNHYAYIVTIILNICLTLLWLYILKLHTTIANLVAHKVETNKDLCEQNGINYLFKHIIPQAISNAESIYSNLDKIYKCTFEDVNKTILQKRISTCKQQISNFILFKSNDQDVSTVDLQTICNEANNIFIKKIKEKRINIIFSGKSYQIEQRGSKTIILIISIINIFIKNCSYQDSITINFDSKSKTLLLFNKTPMPWRLFQPEQSDTQWYLPNFLLCLEKICLICKSEDIILEHDYDTTQGGNYVQLFFPTSNIKKSNIYANRFQ